jgi:hypothetical protein
VIDAISFYACVSTGSGFVACNGELASPLQHPQLGWRWRRVPLLEKAFPVRQNKFPVISRREIDIFPV